jgi:uncharacterized protein (TIGR03085 family)
VSDRAPLLRSRLDERERHELCHLLLDLGPDAPTLCEGWDTLDLAAHLVVREREPRAALGIISDRFAAHTRRRQDAWADKGLEAVIERLRSGPPRLWRVPGLRTLLNLIEFAVHHEDARRANGLGRRADRHDLDDALWSLVGGSARFGTRSLGPIGLELVRPGGERKRVRKGDDVATLTGCPLELVLYLSGRKRVAEVELTGSNQAVTSVAAARFGI